MPEYVPYEYLRDHRSGRTRAYALYGPYRLVTTVMMAVTVVLLCLCIACGLIYLADLAEEFPSRARSLLRALILVNFAVHGSILLIDQLSWWRSCISIMVNVMYLRLLRTFPYIRSLNDPLVLSTLITVLTESAMWYWLSVGLLYNTSYFAVISFFVLLWLVPLGLLASCVLEEERLPGAGMGGVGGGMGSGGRGGSGSKPRSIFHSIVEFLKPPTE